MLLRSNRTTLCRHQKSVTTALSTCRALLPHPRTLADPRSPVLPAARAEAPCSEHAADGGCFKTHFAGFFLLLLFFVKCLRCVSGASGYQVRCGPGKKQSSSRKRGRAWGRQQRACRAPAPHLSASPARRLSRPGAIWSSPTMVSEHTAAEITTQWYGELLISCQ